MVGFLLFFLLSFYTGCVENPFGQYQSDGELISPLKIMGLHDDDQARKNKVWHWDCHGTLNGCEYRFSINDQFDHTFTDEAYSDRNLAILRGESSGMFYLHIQARDKIFKSIKSDMNTYSVEIDVSRPTLSLAPLVDINQRNLSDYWLRGSCSENGYPVFIELGGIGSVATCENHIWETVMNLMTLSDGSHSITVEHWDSVGNYAPPVTASVEKTNGF